MLQHTITIPDDGSMSPQAWFQGIRALPGFVHDAEQAAAIAELDALWHQLIEFKSRRNEFLGRSLLSPAVPKGLYLWGGVGRGKTFLMDAFYACLPYRRKRRIHFHNFMSEVHHEMKLLAHKNDPLLALADKISASTRLLCLDEFHVDDIADAMILGRLLDTLFERGVVLITTSNYAPDELYPHGLQRSNFLPAIDMLKRELKVIHIESGNDYRLRTTTREPLFLVPADVANEELMDALFQLIAGEISPHEQPNESQNRIIPAPVPVIKIARTVVWFDFKILCGGAHDQEDYLKIAHQFPTLFLSHIPKMTAEHAAEAKRFTWLIDVLYDNNVRLVASASAAPEEIYTGEKTSSEFSRTVSRLSEMQSQQYLKRLHHTQRVTL